MRFQLHCGGAVRQDIFASQATILLVCVPVLHRGRPHQRAYGTRACSCMIYSYSNLALVLLLKRVIPEYLMVWIMLNLSRHLFHSSSPQNSLQRQLFCCIIYTRRPIKHFSVRVAHAFECALPRM